MNKNHQFTRFLFWALNVSTAISNNQKETSAGSRQQLAQSAEALGGPWDWLSVPGRFWAPTLAAEPWYEQFGNGPVLSTKHQEEIRKLPSFFQSRLSYGFCKVGFMLKILFAELPHVTCHLEMPNKKTFHTALFPKVHQRCGRVDQSFDFHEFHGRCGLQCGEVWHWSAGSAESLGLWDALAVRHGADL